MGKEEIRLRAEVKNLPEVIRFIERKMKDEGCSMKVRMQVQLAVEEIFVNIANYAYLPGSGDVSVSMEITGDPASAVITFVDQGTPFDPMLKESPDVTLPADKRKIGGLGIFTVKQFMDDVQYEYRDNSNVLTIWKALA